MSAPARTAVIDTDVHCAPAGFADLEPYLDDYWRGYLRDGSQRINHAQGGAYPPLAPTTATPAAREAGSVPPHEVSELRAQLDVGTAILNCTTSFGCNRNPYYETALTRAINDWLVERWLAADSGLRASMVVPTLHTEAAVAEIERIGDHPGIVQVLLPVRGDQPWGNVRHRPLLRAAADKGLVVGLHAWGRVGNAMTSSGFTHTYLEDYLGNSQSIVQAQLVSLLAEGVFAQLPDLRVSLLECGFSWLPTLLWRFDKDWKGVWREVPWINRRSREVIADHVRLTTAPAHLPRDPVQVREALDLLGPADLLMHASDHPHDHGSGGQRLLAALTGTEREAVLRGNAAQWYGIA